MLIIAFLVACQFATFVARVFMPTFFTGAIMVAGILLAFYSLGIKFHRKVKKETKKASKGLFKGISKFIKTIVFKFKNLMCKMYISIKVKLMHKFGKFTSSIMSFMITLVIGVIII